MNQLSTMAAAGEEDMFDSASDTSLDTTQEGGGEEEAPGTYKLISGSRLNASRLWLAGDHLYIFERDNKTVMTATGLKPATHLKCRNYSSGGGCKARASVTEDDKLFLKPGSEHTCEGGGKEKAEEIEVEIKMREQQLANPREDARKIFDQFHGPAAQKKSFNSLRRQMGRIKNSKVPPAPKTPQEAASVIEQSVSVGNLKAVKRKCDKEGFAVVYKEDKVVGDWIRGYYAIPLLPATKVKEGWEYVGTFIPGVVAALQANPERHHLLHKPMVVHKYYKKFWLRQVGPARLSVHDQPHRTNNSAESWHSKVNKNVGSKPKFWDYVEKIVNECLCFVDNVRRFQQGVRITRKRPVTTTQVQIANATRQLERDGDVPKFIRRCRHLAGKKAKPLPEDPEGYQPVSQSQGPPLPRAGAGARASACASACSCACQPACGRSPPMHPSLTASGQSAYRWCDPRG